MLASAGAAVWRILTQPVQNLKTLMQVEGAAGVGIMVSKVSTDGIGALWEGAIGTMGATWLGHYPWCVIVPAVTCSAALSSVAQNSQLPTQTDVHMYSWAVALQP